MTSRRPLLPQPSAADFLRASRGNQQPSTATTCRRAVTLRLLRLRLLLVRCLVESRTVRRHRLPPTVLLHPDIREVIVTAGVFPGVLALLFLAGEADRRVAVD